MSKTFQSNTSSSTSVVTAVQTTVVDLSLVGGVSMASVITADTNAAGTFAASSLAANAVTITAHGYKTGLVGQVTTAGGLPTGLSTSTNYYIIVVDANTVKFASSYNNAVAGTAISLSGGSGNSTFTPTSLAGATVQAQWSNDGTNFVNIGSPTSITTALNFGLTVDRPAYRYLRLSFAITSGSLTTTTQTATFRD